MNISTHLCDCDECSGEWMPEIETERHGNRNYTATSEEVPYLRVRSQSHRKAWEKWLDFFDSVMLERN